tara:strand:- start:1773 stop:1955 length:183 start_codon:yes stop_codon:yes gene_type:complete
MPALIALLPTLLQGIREAVTVISAIRAAARQTGELTADEDAAFQSQLDAMFASDEWQPRK